MAPDVARAGSAWAGNAWSLRASWSSSGQAECGDTVSYLEQLVNIGPPRRRWAYPSHPTVWVLDKVRLGVRWKRKRVRWQEVERPNASWQPRPPNREPNGYGVFPGGYNFNFCCQESKKMMPNDECFHQETSPPSSRGDGYPGNQPPFEPWPRPMMNASTSRGDGYPRNQPPFKPWRRLSRKPASLRAAATATPSLLMPNTH